MTSLLCLAPLGLIFGIVALLQIAKKGQRGKGLAIAGISVSGAVLLLAGLAFAVTDFRVWAPPARTESGEVARPGWTTVHSIEIGDCFNPGAELAEQTNPLLGAASVELVPCGESHRGEAYATVELTGPRAYPGRDWIAMIARPQCGKRFLDYSADPLAFGTLQSYYFSPDPKGWEAGHRTVLCWVARPGKGQLSTSVRLDESNLGAAQLAFLSALKPLNTGAVLRPATSPRQDLARATAWAGAMAEAQAESIRLLKDTKLPGAERPTEQLVAEFEAGLPSWRKAAEAPDADAFYRHLRSVDEHNGDEYALRIRELLDLPLATFEPGAESAALLPSNTPVRDSRADGPKHVLDGQEI